MKFFLVFLLSFVALTGRAQTTNANYVVQAAAAQTAAQVNSPDQLNIYYRGGHIVINVTAYTAGNYTPKVQGKTAGGTYYDVLVGTAISSTGSTILKVYPGVAPVANGSAADFLPQVWRLQMNGASGQSMTYSVEAVLGE